MLKCRKKRLGLSKKGLLHNPAIGLKAYAAANKEMRSAIKNILILILAYRIIHTAITGAMPLDIVLLIIAVALISIWFSLEKAGIL